MALALEQKDRFTWADTLTWDTKERVELIYGEPFFMSAPLRIHQEVSIAIETQLSAFLAGKPCRMYHAPFDVRLFAKTTDRPEDVDTVVQPDICVVCDSSKLDKYGCAGAPDFIIEILSDSTRRHDRHTKFRLYEKAAVREYWVVDTDNRAVQVCLFDGIRYDMPDLYLNSPQLPVSVLDGCVIDFAKVFEGI